MSLCILSFKLHISFEVKRKSIHYYFLLRVRKYPEGRLPRRSSQSQKDVDGDRFEPCNQEARVYDEGLFI